MTLLTDQDLLQALLAHEKIIVYAYDTDGIVTLARGSGHELLGLKAEDGVGKPAFTAVSHNGPENIEHLKLALTGKKFTAIGRYVEDSIFLERSFTPICDQSGKVVEVLGIAFDVTERERAIRERDILIAVGKAMSEKQDLEILLERVARLIIPGFGDYCTIDLADDDGRLRQTSVAHVDQIVEDRLFELQRHYSHEIWPDYLPFRVLRSGETVLHANVTDTMLAKGAYDARELELFRVLKPTSCVLIPMLLGGRALGVLTLARSVSPQHYSENDLPLLEELARRLALAVAFARSN